MTTEVHPRAFPVTRLHHYLSARDLTAEATLAVLELAREMKAEHYRRDERPRLPGRTLAMIFQKPSLRTRVSFEAGMTQLGGHAIYLGPDDIQLGKRESVEDVAIVLSRMADLIMARVFGHAIVEELARHATVPVINGLSDREHPCQALGDLLTIMERKGRLKGLRLVFVGDGNNVANSLLLAGALTGMDVTVACPEGFEPPAHVLAEARVLARASGATLGATSDLHGACEGADVLYTDVWASMGQESETEHRRSAFKGYQLNERVMRLAKPDVVLLHCLPAHYGEEIEYEVSRTPNSAIFEQAENRLHAQKALMVTLAGQPATGRSA
ncbi:MAG: ornithine carbamoyltransferase [Candidatus Eisenbacteria bacterium]